jgi:hypothetical protein
VGPCDLARRARRRAGRDAVVDHDHRPPGERHRRPVAAEQPCPALDLGALALFDLGEFGLADPAHVHDPVVDDPHAPFAHRPHGQLRLERDAELAHHDHVEGCAEPARDLVPDYDAATGQPDDHEVLTGEEPQRLDEPPAGVGAIGEEHDNLPRRGPVSTERPPRCRR